MNAKSGLFCLALSLAVTACAPEQEIDQPTESGDQSDVDVVHQGIVGATSNPTNAHPEVARITHSGGTCSAVLVRSHFMLTNSHCLNAPNGRDGIGGTVTFRRADGTALPTAVNWTDGRVFVWDGGFDPANDIAIIRLSRDVTEIAPARLANRQPIAGEMVDAVGWGCDNRGTQANGGVKRMYRGAYPTNVVCAGDSGGGLFLADGTLAKVLAADGDYYGDVVGFRHEIEAMIRSFDGNFEHGIDRQGNDYRDFASTSALDCKTQCNRDARCRAFSFNRGAQRCWLKDGAMAFAFVNDSTSGVPDNTVDGFDTPGNDLSNFATTNINVCANACAKDKTCNAYTLNLGNGRCYLKSGVGAWTSNSNCRTGVRRSFDNNTDRPGGDYRNFAPATTASCESSCETDTRCVAWTLNSGRCYLKNILTDAVRSNGVQSTYRRGWDFFYDYAGSNISQFNMNLLKPEACQAFCRNVSTCQAWSIVRSKDGSGNRNCYIKNGVPARNLNYMAVTGLAFTSFF